MIPTFCLDFVVLTVIDNNILLSIWNFSGSIDRKQFWDNFSKKYDAEFVDDEEYNLDNLSDAAHDAEEEEERQEEEEQEEEEEEDEGKV